MDGRKVWKIVTRALLARLRGDREYLLQQKRRLLFLLAEEELDSMTFERDGTHWTVPSASSSIAKNLLVEGEHQGPETRALLDWLGPRGHLERDIIVEVGANIGTPSISLCRATKKTVIAIEPMPENFAFLERNVMANGLGDRVRCIRAAVSRDAGEIDMVWHPTGGMSEVKTPGGVQGFGEVGSGSAVVRVPARPLDEILQSEDVDPASVCFVWSDTQGHERQVVESGSALWKAGVPLFVEVWKQGLAAHGGVDAFLEVAARHFSELVTRRELLESGADARPRPISELGAIVAGLRGHTDALFLPG